MRLENYPYPSRRSAVLADNGMVATSQPLAAQAGLSMLTNGGNAVDAALAAAAALTVVEPTSNGIGGDAFALVWDGQRLHGLNGSGRWPGALDAEQFRAGGRSALPSHGWASVTVPGAPAAWEALYERFSHLPMDQILEPAARYAEDGYPVSPVVAHAWRRAAEVYLTSNDPAQAGWREVFAPGDTTPAAGERWRGPGHARCLRTLARRGIRDFYEGEIAEQIVAWAAATDGALTGEDLGGHRSQWVDPISICYRDHEVWELPPNGQGIAALEALGLLARMDPASQASIGAEAWHHQIEAMKLALADAYRYVADPDVEAVPVAGLLADDYLDERRALMGERAADPGYGMPPDGGTVYLCTADRDGMMVSLIQSNYMGFGSGVVVPEVGVALQNRAACFTLEPGHPNEAAGGKRPRHTIIPAFLTRGGEAVGPFGVMGGEMQPQGHLQVVSAMLDQGLNCQAALDAPRWRVMGGLAVTVEPEVDDEVVSALEQRGHRVKVAPDAYPFGRGQIIARLESGAYAGGSEPRADGAAVGW